jgi:hypothetical protein
MTTEITLATRTQFANEVAGLTSPTGAVLTTVSDPRVGRIERCIGRTRGWTVFVATKPSRKARLTFLAELRAAGFTVETDPTFMRFTVAK